MTKIRTMFVFEIMGRPAEHIKSTLNQFIDQLGTLPTIKIESRKVYEPKAVEIKDVENLFSTFAEVELTADNLDTLFDIVLNMLPSHIEVIEPSELRMQNFDLSNTLSKLTMKIHKYDEIAKASLMKEKMFEQKLNEMQAKINELEGKDSTKEDSENVKEEKEKTKVSDKKSKKKAKKK